MLTALALTLVTASACGGGGSVENKEYDEYAMQVRTVMYDLGLTAEKPQTEDSQTALVQAQTLLAGATPSATYDENKTQIWELAQSYAGKTERDTLSAYTNIFEQSFYIPLIMGKALADHYKVDTFYGVCANSPWNQYVQTLKDGNVKTTSVYTPAGEVFEKETFIQMALDYVNETEYEIRVTQFAVDYSRVFFTYIDGETYLEISYEAGNTENCYVSYSVDGFSGWNCKNESLALQVKDLIQDEFTRVDQAAMRAIQTNAKYTVNEEKWEEASAVFLSGGGDGVTQIPFGWADENQTVLSSYRCFETTERIEIPARVRYLTNDFFISYDGVEPTKELFIPKTVIGIKGYNREDVDNPSPDASAPNLIDLTAKDFRIQTWNWQPLENIIVEEGSTLFMEGEGHLRALDGEVVCYLNQAHPTGKVYQTEFMAGGKLSYDLLSSYPLLTASITELVCSENYLGEIWDLVRLFPALRTLHVTFPAPVGDEMRGLQLECTGDLDLYLYAEGSYAIEYIGNGTLTVYLDRKEVSLHIRAQNSVVYSKWNKTENELLEALGRPRCEGATTVHYEEEEDASLKGISLRQEWYGLEAVVDTAEASSFTVPQELFEYAIEYVKIENSVNTPVRVTLSSSVRELRINNTWEEDGKKNYGSNITVVYDGTKTAFLNVFLRGDSSPQYINAECSDYTGKISGFVQKVTLVNEAAAINETYYLFTNGDNAITGRTVLPSYDEQKRYYYTDEQGNRYNVTNASSQGGTLVLNYTYFDDPADVTLTYHEEEATAILVILVETADMGQTSVYADTVRAGTRVLVENRGDGKLYITIEPASSGTEPPPSNVVREAEIPSGMIYQGESEYIINEDTTLNLCIR